MGTITSMGLGENKSLVLSAGKLCEETKGFTRSFFSTNTCFHRRKGVRFNSQMLVNGEVASDLMVCTGKERQGAQDRRRNRGLARKKATAERTSFHKGALQAHH